MKKVFAGLLVGMLLCGFCAPTPAAGQGIGSTAVGFTLKDLAGQTYHLTDYRDKQPVLLFFWTTWCPFCLKKLQQMNTELLALEKDGIALLAVNVAERRSSVERLVRNYAIKYTVLLDEAGTVSEDYFVRGVPTFVLIDINGTIRYWGNEYPEAEIQQVVGTR